MQEEGVGNIKEYLNLTLNKTYANQISIRIAAGRGGGDRKK